MKQGLNTLRLTASSTTALARGVRGRIHSICLTPAAAAVLAGIWDGVQAGGKKISDLQAAANGNSAILDLGDNFIPFQDGLDIVVSGTGVILYVYWEPLD